MHLFHVATVFLVLLLVGSEFCVAAFVDPNAWRLKPEPQSKLLSYFASVLGKVMPPWYAVGLILLAVETWLHRQAPGFWLLLTASVIWLLATLASILFLVPLNNRVIQGSAGWQAAHRSWDRRHRLRVIALAISSLLLIFVLVC